MIVIWIFTCAFCALTVELLAANAGLLMPVLGVAAFYLFTVYRWERPLLPLALMAAALDITLGRPTFVTLLLLLPTALLARVWRRHGDRREMMIQALPGLILGIAWGCGILTLESLLQEHVTFVLLRHNLWLLLQCIILTTVATPVGIVLLDGVSRRLALPRYAVARYTGGMHHA